jgi:hypothetical protein
VRRRETDIENNSVKSGHFDLPERPKGSKSNYLGPTINNTEVLKTLLLYQIMKRVFV